MTVPTGSTNMAVPTSAHDLNLVKRQQYLASENKSYKYYMSLQDKAALHDTLALAKTT